MKTSRFLTFAVVATMFAACSNENIPVDETKDTPITIASAGVAELTTRVITDDKLVGITDGEPATMSVFITGGSETKYNATNAKWEHDGTSWDSETDVFFEGRNSAQKIYACSPYTTVTDNNITVTATEQTDWLVATATDLTSSAVNLTMTHALTKLVLVPTLGTELTSQTITSVEVGGMYASGTLNVSDNSWSDLLEANTTLAMANNELLVIPMASCTSLPITITMEDARVFKTTINLATVGNKLEAGTQYNIALQIGQDKVTLGEITASSWGSPVDSGQLETE